MTPDLDNSVTAELLALEQRRCEAIVACDEASLRELLAPNLVHVHTRGNQDSLESYLLYLKGKVEIVKLERRDIKLAIYDNLVVMTGGQINTARLRGSDDEPTKVESQVMQVWVKGGRHWQLVAFQATPTGALPSPVPR